MSFTMRFPELMLSEDERKRLTSALITRRLGEIGRTMMDLAKACEVSFTAAQGWARGRNLPAPKRFAPIAKFLQLPESDILAVVIGPDEQSQKLAIETNRGTPQNGTTKTARVLDVPELGPRDVPVLGVVVGGSDADFSLNGETVSYVRRPAAIANLNEVYALYTVGDSMSPRYKDGELIYVHRREPAVGDHVVVHLRGETPTSPTRGFVKYLIRRNGSTIVCGQYNPEGEVTYPREDLIHLDRIIPWHELLGV